MVLCLVPSINNQLKSMLPRLLDGLYRGYVFQNLDAPATTGPGQTQGAEASGIPNRIRKAVRLHVSRDALHGRKRRPRVHAGTTPARGGRPAPQARRLD